MTNTREKLDVHSKLMGLIQRAPYIGCEDVHRQYAVNWLMNEGVTVQEWIPVSERPPEVASKHKRYRHSYTKSIRVLCACVQKDGKKMVKEGYCVFWDDYPIPYWKIPGTIDFVTHWAYLPQPPKGE